MYCTDLFLCSHLSDCIPGLHFTGPLVSVLPFEPFVIDHLSFFCSCLNAALQMACSWSCTLTLHFHVIKDFTLSLLWQLVVHLKFLLEEPLWHEPILTFSHPSVIENYHSLASSPQNHFAQEIGSWSSFPSLSFRLLKRTYESAPHLVVYYHLHTHLKLFHYHFPRALADCMSLQDLTQRP